jgi:hypothetical protein
LHNSPARHPAHVTGQILVNGVEVPSNAFRHVTSFAQAHDMFMGALNVRETLHFAYRLAGAPRGNEAEARVNTLLLLSAGKTHYFGAISQLADYYGSIGVTVPGRANPADFLLELVNTDFAQNQAAASERERVADLASRWDRSALRQQNVEGIASVRSAAPELALAVLTH